jgi:hypothetical protein
MKTKPVRPNNEKRKDMIASNEENEREEIRLEAEMAKRQKAIDELDKKLEEIKEAEKNLEEDEWQACEPERLKKLPVIQGPTDKERELHERYHIPYRSWCEICVQAKKKNTPHHSVKDKRTFPVISMDYMFFNDKSAVIVLKDSNFGGVWALVVIRKGNGGEYAATRVADIINKLGYPRCILKCDQEPKQQS